MRPEDLAPIASELNDVQATGKRTDRLAPLVEDTNAIIRAAADALINLDSTPLSFQALKAASEPRT